VGSREDAVTAPAAATELPGKTHYLAKLPDAPILDVPSFADVRCRDIYPGIDAVFHGDQQRLEYDFVLRPGADPEQIRIAFDGVAQLELDAEGDLRLSTARGTLTQLRPNAWQERPYGQRPVRARYVLVSDKAVRFALDSVDRTQLLVIDPVVAWSAYDGAAGSNRGTAVAVDATGASYLAGTTTSAVSQGFITKVNPEGTAFVYTNILSSSWRSETVAAAAADPAGSVYFTGLFTEQDPAGPCGMRFILAGRLDPTGRNLFSAPRDRMQSVAAAIGGMTLPVRGSRGRVRCTSRGPALLARASRLRASPAVARRRWRASNSSPCSRVPDFPKKVA
jgi:hypothetical protein